MRLLAGHVFSTHDESGVAPLNSMGRRIGEGMRALVADVESADRSEDLESRLESMCGWAHEVLLWIRLR